VTGARAADRIAILADEAVDAIKGARRFGFGRDAAEAVRNVEGTLVAMGMAAGAGAGGAKAAGSARGKRA